MNNIKIHFISMPVFNYIVYVYLTFTINNLKVDDSVAGCR